MPYWPLDQKLNRNIDRRAGTITRAVNAMRDDAMHWRRFPGLASFCDLGTDSQVTPYWWERIGLGVAVSAGNLYKITPAWAATLIPGASLHPSGHPYFADFGATLYIANGGRMVQWDGGASCSYVADEDAPTDVVQIAAFGAYLLALDSQGGVWHSDAAAPGTWLGDFFTAQSQPDLTIAMQVGWEEVVLFGTSTVQSFFNSGDATDTIQAIQGSTIEVGVIAPDSVQKIDNTYFFLDSQRKVQRVRARQNQVVSEPINADLQALGTVNDAIGFHLTCNGETFYCIVFPTDGRGFAYDYKRDDWTEFAGFANGEYTRPKMTSAAYMQGWNKHIAGGYDGKLYQVSTAYNAEGANELRFELNLRMPTGTDTWKLSRNVRFKLKRGYGTSTPYMSLSYRDQGKAVWSNEKFLDLGTLTNDQEEYVELRRLGRYRDREWKIVVTDSVPVLIISAEEDVSRG